MSAIISIKDLKMTYSSKIRKGLFSGAETKQVHALKSIDLDIPEGVIFGLLGPNGAGKTTLIKCLTTLLIPTSGILKINGYDVINDEKQVRASIGCMLMGERGLYWKLTGRENLTFFGRLYSLDPDFILDRIQYLIKLLELEEFIDRTVESYSSGQRMKVAFAKALLNDAPVIFLDEPTIAMDVQGARKLRQIVKKLPSEGKTVVYTSHIMSEITELCDEVAIIDEGRIIAKDTPDNIKKLSKMERSVKVTGVISEDIVAKLNSLEFVKGVGTSQTNDGLTSLQIEVSGDSSLHKIMEVIINNGGIIDALSRSEPSLEDVFIELTGRSLSEDTRK